LKPPLPVCRDQIRKDFTVAVDYLTELMEEALFFIRQQALDLPNFRFKGGHGGVMSDESAIPLRGRREGRTLMF
jgi:hypothetical protein